MKLATKTKLTWMTNRMLRIATKHIENNQFSFPNAFLTK